MTHGIKSQAFAAGLITTRLPDALRLGRETHTKAIFRLITRAPRRSTTRRNTPPCAPRAIKRQ